MSEDSTARKEKKLSVPRAPISNPKNYIINTDVDGMCVPLKTSLCQNMYQSLKVENLFPYVECGNGTFGFFFKHVVDGNEIYSSLPNADWRSILGGKKNKLRPNSLEQVRKINNRVDVKTKKGDTIQICYWPDSYYQERLNNSKRNKRKGEEKEKKADTSTQGDESSESEDMSQKAGNGKKEEKPSASALAKKKALDEALSSENDKKVLTQSTGGEILANSSFSALVPTIVNKTKAPQTAFQSALFDDENLQSAFHQFMMNELQPEEVSDVGEELDRLLESEDEQEEQEMPPAPPIRRMEIPPPQKVVPKEPQQNMTKIAPVIKETPKEELKPIVSPKIEEQKKEEPKKDTPVKEKEPVEKDAAKPPENGKAKKKSKKESKKKKDKKEKKGKKDKKEKKRKDSKKKDKKPKETKIEAKKDKKRKAAEPAEEEPAKKKQKVVATDPFTEIDELLKKIAQH